MLCDLNEFRMRLESLVDKLQRNLDDAGEGAELDSLYESIDDRLERMKQKLVMRMPT